MRKLTMLAVLASLFIAGLGLTAQAHDFTGGGDCQGFTLTLDGTFGAHTIIINGQAQAEVTTSYFIADNVANRTERSFTVKWDKDQGDVTKVHTVTRSTADCVDFDVAQECGLVEVANFRNDTAINYAVAFEEGAATYDLGNASFGSVAFDEDYNGGSVEVSYYLVGGEKDFIIGDQTDLPNFWEQSAATVTVDTDCEPPVATPPTTTPPTTTPPTTPPTTVPPTTDTTINPGPPITLPCVVDCEPPAPETTVTLPEELPFTGVNAGRLVVAAIAMAGLGSALAYTFRDRLS